MVFTIDYNLFNASRRLKYNKTESSFEMTPYPNSADFSIILNYLELSFDQERRLVHVAGYCPVGSWEKKPFTIPQSKRGSVIIDVQLESGSSYRLNREGEWPVYKNPSSDWICVGSLAFEGESVEFLENCIAVLKDGHLVSLLLLVQFQK